MLLGMQNMPTGAERCTHLIYKDMDFSSGSQQLMSFINPSEQQSFLAERAGKNPSLPPPAQGIPVFQGLKKEIKRGLCKHSNNPL